jgi:hypothetical protein
LEEILSDVVSIRGDGDVVPKLILERRGNTVLAGMVPFMTGSRIRQRLKFMF